MFEKIGASVNWKHIREIYHFVLGHKYYFTRCELIEDNIGAYYVIEVGHANPEYVGSSHMFFMDLK